jgi:dTDP-4-dehydrorhamnose 3,5-epimerase-like enzyme
MDHTLPYLIQFPKIGNPQQGYISVAEFEKALPFVPQRLFWTYYTPEEIVRGRHAHHRTEQVLVALAGRILVTTEQRSGEIATFVLEKPEVGLYIPPSSWHTMQYSHNAIQLAFASLPYDETDYIRDYKNFQAS